MATAASTADQCSLSITEFVSNLRGAVQFSPFREEDPVTDKFDNDGQKRKLDASRRKFFTWTGQVVAGISLAGIGLGFSKVSNVLQCQIATLVITA